ncbi:MAG: hypothetical protein QQN63_08890, partial [Nitrosopumilus sp.]
NVLVVDGIMPARIMDDLMWLWLFSVAWAGENGLANKVDSTMLENGRVFSIDPRFESEVAVNLPADLETGYYYIKVHDGSSFYLSNRIWIVNLYN